MNDESRPAWLERHLDTLPRELTPRHDLWPAVARRLTRPARTPWHTTAVAATLLLSVGLALFGWQAYRAAQHQSAATAAMIADILAPYEQARATQAARWLALQNTLDPVTFAALQADVATLRGARATLTAALTRAPTDPELHRLLQQVTARETELLEAGTRLDGAYL